MNGILALTFEIGTASCGDWGGWVPSGFCGGCGGHGRILCVFSIIFVSYLNDLSSEALSSTSSIP